MEEEFIIKSHGNCGIIEKNDKRKVPAIGERDSRKIRKPRER